MFYFYYKFVAEKLYIALSYLVKHKHIEFNTYRFEQLMLLIHSLRITDYFPYNK